jgi:hypothetical protein
LWRSSTRRESRIFFLRGISGVEQFQYHPDDLGDLSVAQPTIMSSPIFRWVALEYLMGKDLTAGGSRRYLWASFVVLIDLALPTGWLSGETPKLRSTAYAR